MKEIIKTCGIVILLVMLIIVPISIVMGIFHPKKIRQIKQRSVENSLVIKTPDTDVKCGGIKDGI